jgi:hypothetical protein
MRHVVHDPALHEFTLIDPDGKIGSLKYTISKNGISPSMIVNHTEGTTTPKHGISQDLYDAAITYAHSIGKEGLISGEVSWQPEML